MTKETKIGLLVGLGFIILFAIILSEKGASNKTRPPSDLTIADSGSLTSTEEPLGRAGKLSIETRTASANRPQPSTRSPVMSQEQIGQEIPREGDPVSPLPDSVVNNLNMGEVPTETEIPIQIPESDDTRSMSIEEAVAGAITRDRTSDEADEDDESMSEASHLANNNAKPAPSERRGGTAMRIVANHTVKPGESLGKIAARYYGRSTPARVDAIFNANRDSLNSIHAVRANAKLKIPALDAEGKIEFDDTEDFPATEVVKANRSRRSDSVRIPIPVANRGSRRTLPPTPAESTTTQKFTWYKVRNKDTLSRIAKRELGSERRYKEIYNLNRDIIPSLNVIREGMKIRLPARGPVRISALGPVGPE